MEENNRLKRLIEEAEKKKNDDGPNPKFLNNLVSIAKTGRNHVKLN